MRRWKTTLAIAFLLTLFVTLSLAPESPASSLRSQLRTARHQLRATRYDLRVARVDLATALLNGVDRGLGSYRKRVATLKHEARLLRARVASLRRQLRVDSGDEGWRPLIEVVARENRIDPDGLYRMMIYESGGRAMALGGGGLYKGLFQYSSSTWRGSWNPWRSQSIFSGAAQIRATARAIRLGRGPHWWPRSYPRAF